ncbi:hypothetical protein FB451DRAFT_1043666 [Mycena latifolia]|nr:hypothetical protein FB451DRAFT_1043666 [Mycena latifolia]
MIPPYILVISRNVWQLLRKPLSFLLCMWLLAWLSGQMSVTTKSTFSPFCFFPGISRAPFCSPDPRDVEAHGSLSTPSPRWVDFPALMAIQHNTMEQLLEENSLGSALALHIKKAKMATRDLTTLVRYSNLKSRDELAVHLEQFGKEAESTSNSLTILSSKVYGEMDSIMKVNEYGLRSIQAAPSPSDSSIPHYLNPWPATSSPSVTQSFETSMRYLSQAIRRLVVEFEINIRQLDTLGRELVALHEMVAGEGIIDSAIFEVLGQLWMVLGANIRQSSTYECNLQLLMNVNEYRKQALAHVVIALQKLRQMGGDIEDLRQRVSEPKVIGAWIPAEVHIRSIQSSLERLKESQAQAQVREEVVHKEALLD